MIPDEAPPLPLILTERPAAALRRERPPERVSTGSGSDRVHGPTRVCNAGPRPTRYRGRP
ncbi:MAG: hypothetical protein M3362_03525 [Acidobacteriota bacterium]|nr:hypothetical protein [Acidobacteriota bacterium]